MCYCFLMGKWSQISGAHTSRQLYFPFIFLYINYLCCFSGLKCCCSFAVYSPSLCEHIQSSVSNLGQWLQLHLSCWAASSSPSFFLWVMWFTSVQKIRFLSRTRSLRPKKLLSVHLLFQCHLAKKKKKNLQKMILISCLTFSHSSSPSPPPEGSII